MSILYLNAHLQYTITYFYDIKQNKNVFEINVSFVVFKKIIIRNSKWHHRSSLWNLSTKCGKIQQFLVKLQKVLYYCANSNKRWMQKIVCVRALYSSSVPVLHYLQMVHFLYFFIKIWNNIHEYLIIRYSWILLYQEVPKTILGNSSTWYCPLLKGHPYPFLLQGSRNYI